MKQKISLRFSFRMMAVVLSLAALPFMVLVLNNKPNPLRKVASEDGTRINTNTNSDLNRDPSAFKYETLRGVAIEKTSQEVGLKLGLFLVNNNTGNKVPVCDLYPFIDLVFAAEGIAFSGETPQMIVRGPCVVSTDQKNIEALPIPFHEILSSPPQKYEFHSLLRGQGKVQIYFRNVVGFWPTKWSWSGVTFYHKNYNKDSKKKLEINGYETISVLGAPLIIDAMK